MSYFRLPAAYWPNIIINAKDNIMVEYFFSTKFDTGCMPMSWSAEEPKFYNCGCVITKYKLELDCGKVDDCDFRKEFT